MRDVTTPIPSADTGRRYAGEDQLGAMLAAMDEMAGSPMVLASSYTETGTLRPEVIHTRAMSAQNMDDEWEAAVGLAMPGHPEIVILAGAPPAVCADEMEAREKAAAVITQALEQIGYGYDYGGG